MTALKCLLFDADGNDITAQVVDKNEKYLYEYIQLCEPTLFNDPCQSHLRPSERSGSCFIGLCHKPPQQTVVLPARIQKELARSLRKKLKPQGLLVEQKNGSLYIARDQGPCKGLTFRAMRDAK